MRRALLLCIALVACSGGGPKSVDTGASAAPADDAAPPAVTSVNAFSQIESVFVFWTPPSSAVPISGFIVEDLNGATQVLGVVAGTTFSGLRGGSVHCFRVFAVANRRRSPPPPAPTCAKAYSRTVASPVNVRAEATPGGARVSWDPPPANDGPPIGAYGIRARQDSGSEERSSSTTNTSITFTGLVEGARYTFAVVAYAAGMPGEASEPATSNAVTVRTVWPAGRWRQGPSLSDAFAQFAGVLGDWIYVVTAAGIHSAKLDADGAPGPWSVAGDRDQGRIGWGGSSSVALFSIDGTSGYLFLDGGGESMSGYTGDVFVAPVPGDGTVGKFRRAPSFAPGSYASASATDRNHLYVLGGWWWSGGSYTGVGSPLAFVHVADLQADGTPGPWRNTALLPRTGNWRVVVRNHRMYALAPHGSGIDVLYCDLREDGSIAAWKRASAQPDVMIANFAVAAEGDFLYVAGGSQGGNPDRPLASVLVGHIGPDGDLLAWEQSASDAFNGPRSSPVLTSARGRLYLVGGANFSDVQWAEVDPASGHLAPTPPPPRPRPPSAPLRIRASPLDSAALVRWDPPTDDGGSSISGYTVKLWPDGESIEMGADATQAIFGGLQNFRAFNIPTFQVFARNGAGEGPGSGPSDDVFPSPSRKWRASGVLVPPRRPLFPAGTSLFASGPRPSAVPLDADGVPWTSIGPGWEGHSPVLSSWAQAWLRVDESTACVYVLGGNDHALSIASTSATCMRGDGFFGSASSAPTTTALPMPRSHGAAAISGNFLYVAGGQQTRVDGTLVATLADVSFAPIGVNGDIGGWTQTTALPEPRAAPAIAAHGADLLLLRGREILRARRASDGTLSHWLPLPVTLAADATDGKMVVSGDVLYVVAPGTTQIGRFDSDGGISAWELDADAGLPLSPGTFELTTSSDRLYVSTATVVVARIDRSSGRLLPWTE